MTSITRLIIKRRRRRSALRRQRNRQAVVLTVLALAFALVVVVPAVVVVGRVWLTYSQAVADLPAPQSTTLIERGGGVTRLYDSSGRVQLFAVADPLQDSRAWVDLADLPDYLLIATVLWEDRNFGQRSPASLWRTGEALWRNWLSATPEATDSTITGRLVRRAILRRPDDQPATSEARAQEIATIAAVNRRYTPDQILEWHLNTNFYGNEAYGIEAAAQVYLGKSAVDLTLDEAALLAAIATEPRFNPIDDESRARDRQADLLRRLLSAGAITQAEFQAVIDTVTPVLRDGGQTPELAPDFALYARRQAEGILNNQGLDGAQLVARGGLRIITTLDLTLFDQVECTLSGHIQRLNGTPQPDFTRTGEPCIASGFLPEDVAVSTAPPQTGAVVILSPQTGEILTMNGTATRAAYQPAPVLYPLVYLHGFLSNEPNYSPATMLLDISRTYPAASEGAVIVPANPNGVFYGPLTVRDSMAAGLVAPAFEVAAAFNMDDIVQNTARLVGMDSLRGESYTLDLLQRGGGVSLLDAATTYATFAAMGEAYGVRVAATADDNRRSYDPVAVRRIESADGEILWHYDAEQIARSRVPVLQGELAYLMNDILSDNAAREPFFGADNSLTMARRSAVVNGITADSVDNWAVGYTPQLLVGVHLQRDERDAMALDGFALDGAAAVWRALMDYTHERDELPVVQWQMPSGMVRSPVCLLSGMSPNDVCETRPEIFLDGSQIPPRDTHWQIIDINTQTGQRASVTTPGNLIESVTYFIPPPDALAWWTAAERPLPPERFDTITRPDILSPTAILRPNSYDVVGGVVDVRGSVDAEALDFYQILYGQGANPSRWTNITEPQTEFTPGVSMAEWDTRGLDGTYILQLRVVNQDNSVDSSYVQVIVDNQPPTIALSTGEDVAVPIRYPEQTVIPVVADVADNISVVRVEVYHDGQAVAELTQFPFRYEHPITRTGDFAFRAVAYDAAGNTAEATLEVAVIRSSSG
ncbi:MAG: hypothetical protein EA396_08210 [Anaerolineaceae bacterium]|nr:MAG: hypothetical protein EA396_08210 [Anaerolineaceae bacterium]